MSEIKAYLKKIGAQGGHTAAANMTPAERSARAKKAADAATKKRKGKNKK